MRAPLACLPFGLRISAHHSLLSAACSSLRSPRPSPTSVRQSLIFLPSCRPRRVGSSQRSLFWIRSWLSVLSPIGGSVHETCFCKGRLGDSHNLSAILADREYSFVHCQHATDVSPHQSASSFTPRRTMPNRGNGSSQRSRRMLSRNRPFAEDGVISETPLTDLEKEKFKTVTIEPTNKLLTLPTILTLARVAAVPAILAVFYSKQSWATPAGATIFVLAAVTDWLDGYLARKMGTSSAFGAFLDPVADKLMVAAALVLLCSRPLPITDLVSIPWLLPVPTIAIIGREITMSAVREWAASQGGDLHKAVAVNNLGKVKTACQMVAITLLLGSGEGGLNSSLAGFVGIGLLYVASGLALWSLAMYMKAIWGSMFK